MRKFMSSLPPYGLQAWCLIIQREMTLHVEIYMLTKRIHVKVYTRCKTQMHHKRLQIPFETFSTPLIFISMQITMIYDYKT